MVLDLALKIFHTNYLNRLIFIHKWKSFFLIDTEKNYEKNGLFNHVFLLQRHYENVMSTKFHFQFTILPTFVNAKLVEFR